MAAQSGSRTARPYHEGLEAYKSTRSRVPPGRRSVPIACRKLVLGRRLRPPCWCPGCPARGTIANTVRETPYTHQETIIPCFAYQVVPCQDGVHVREERNQEKGNHQGKQHLEDEDARGDQAGDLADSQGHHDGRKSWREKCISVHFGYKPKSVQGTWPRIKLGISRRRIRGCAWRFLFSIRDHVA